MLNLQTLKLTYEYVENFIFEIVHPKAMRFIYDIDNMAHNSPFHSCLLLIAYCQLTLYNVIIKR